MKKIKVAIADDHVLFVKGMASLIENFEGIELVIEAKDGMDLLNKLRRRRPHVILMDLKMPEMDGLEATRYVVAEYPKIKIIALTMYDDEKFVKKMLEIGAHGYMVKNTEPDEVEKGIRAVMKNEFFFSNSLSKKILTETFTKSKLEKGSALKANLSARDLEILKLICNGYTSAEIACKICLSPRTVEGYRKKLLDRVGAKNIAGLVAYAIKNDLVELEGDV